ncbi:MAG: DUF3089 domain-containing protein, partial [Byssovorax sp.]
MLRHILMPLSSLRSSLLGFTLLSAGCALPPRTVVPSGLQSPFTGYSSEKYRADDMWLCRPDLPVDICRGEATATELREDQSRSVVKSTPAARPSVDCFYVYPTVDHDLLPGNHEVDDDKVPAARATLSQITPFNGVCSIYVPVYRQVTIGTYLFGKGEGEGEGPRSEVAFSDVEDAFLHYMGRYNHGRKVVLIGHSQGAGMIVHLLKRRFENDPV